VAQTPFAQYLRFGRVRRTADAIEVKFNPYHDPRNGQFTFGPGGPASTADKPRTPSRLGPGGVRPQSAGSKAPPNALTNSDPEARARNLDPNNPDNYTLHTVKAGESLSKIAALRKGVTPADLAWLNSLPNDARLRIGQQIKLPTQASSDAARDARNRFLALENYLRTHNRQMPPPGTPIPSLESQLLGPEHWTRFSGNGYNYDVDPAGRMRRLTGTIAMSGYTKRNRKFQREAGGRDRLPTDDGGHFLAPRFAPPDSRYNYFAQYRNFNRGAYRLLEQRWHSLRKEGHPPKVNISPIYSNFSQRPDVLVIRYFDHGVAKRVKLFNRKSGR
jgi:hypothetical protein